MTPQPPTPPPDDREARLTALLLGELPADEAAALRQQLQHDADLRRLHDRLAQTIHLVREAAAAPDLDPLASPEAPKLSADRREKLLASFKVVQLRPSKLAQWHQAHWRECAALAAMLVALLTVAAIMMFNSVDSRFDSVNGRPEGVVLHAYSPLGALERRLGLGRAKPRTAIAGADTTMDAEFAADAALSRAEAKFHTGAAAGFDDPGKPGSKFTAQLFGSDAVSGTERPTLLNTVLAEPQQAGAQSPSAANNNRATLNMSTIALPTLGDAAAEVRENGRRSELAQGQTAWFGNNEAKPGNGYWGVGVNGVFAGAGASHLDGTGDSPDGTTRMSLAQTSTADRGRMPVIPAEGLPAGVGGAPVPTATPRPQAGGVFQGGGGGGFAEHAGTSVDRNGAWRSGIVPVPTTPPPAPADAGIVMEKEPFSERTDEGFYARSTLAAPQSASKDLGGLLNRPIRTHRPTDLSSIMDLDDTKRAVVDNPGPAPASPAPASPPLPALLPPLVMAPVVADVVQVKNEVASVTLGGTFKSTNSLNGSASFAFGIAPTTPAFVQDSTWAVPGVAVAPGTFFAGKSAADFSDGRESLISQGLGFGSHGSHQAGNAGDLSNIEAKDKKPADASGPAPSITSFGNRMNNVINRSGGGLEANQNQPVKTAEGDALGVLSAEAVGFVNIDATQLTEQSLRTQIQSSMLGGATVNRLQKPSGTSKGMEESLAESEKVAGLAPRDRFDSQSAKVQGFDVDGTKLQLREWDESGRSSGKKPVAPTLREPELNKHRVEIALPQTERGEAVENLRIASGPIAPIVINEIHYHPAVDPATGLPATVPATRLPAGEPAVDEMVALMQPEPSRKPNMKLQPARPMREATRARPPSADGETKLEREVAAQAAQGVSPEIELLTRELGSLNQVRDRLAAKISQDQLEAKLPREATGVLNSLLNGDVGQEPSPTLAQRVRGFFGGSVERSAVIPIEKDVTDTQGLGEARTAGFDPYWMQTEAERIKSKQMLSKVVEKLNLNETWAEKYGGGQSLKTEDAVKLLQKQLDVRQEAQGSLLDIRAKSESAEEAARIANTVAEVYREDRQALAGWRTTNALRLLQKELTVQNQKIAAVQQELERRGKLVAAPQADKPLPKLAAGAPVPQPEISATENIFSTFSLNVSDVSFKLAAASLEKGQMPEPASIRTEEFINAFDYRDPEPGGSAPIAFAWERARYPFAHDRDLVRFSVKTAASGRQPGRPLNLVLAIDNSGSMERADRVRILRECLRVLGGQLQPQDRVSVVAFARTARLVLDGFSGRDAANLAQWAGNLSPEGGTNLEDAMHLAYQVARRHYLSNGVNRVVLLTDGAANLGDVQPESLKAKVESNRRQGIALDCFGIGWDGYNDDLLEQLSRNGDGRYGFVNTTEAAASEFAGQLAGALKVAASDVKVQVEWNPRRVTAWRQIGYAKHQLKKEQFRDNTVDAAEIGAAEAGNALYTVQVNPAGEGPLGTVRVRFKVPGTSDYREHEWPLPYAGAARSLEQTSAAMRLAASASAFSEWLVSSPFAAEVTPDQLLSYLRGVPENWGVDGRPKKLEWMIRQAKSVAGK